VNLSSKRSVTIVAGLSGYGKNTFLLRYLVNADLIARFLFDPDPGEFNPDLGEFADRLELDATRDAYDLALHLCRGWICFDPHTLFRGRPDTGCEFFCDWAFEKSGALPGEKAIVIDEAWKYCSANKIPDALRAVALSGRKVRLQLFVNTQEPQRLNDTFKGGCSEVVCFRLQSEKQLAFAREMGFDAEEVARLGPLQWIARNIDSGGELRGTIKV
jgi:hypothetical protein